MPFNWCHYHPSVLEISYPLTHLSRVNDRERSAFPQLPGALMVTARHSPVTAMTLNNSSAVL